MKKTTLIFFLLTAIISFFVFDLDRVLTLDNIRNNQENLIEIRNSMPIITSLIFVGLYVLLTSLSLPGAAIMTIAGGALFGLVWGCILISFSSTIGATLAFLVSRYLLRESVQKRFGDKLQLINNGLEKDGAIYLFTLRLVPLFPFFLINILMGITNINTWTYYWVSQLGMLAGTLVYVNAGTQLSKIDSPDSILSLPFIISFALLGIFPLIARKIADIIGKRKLLTNEEKQENLREIR